MKLIRVNLSIVVLHRMMVTDSDNMVVVERVVEMCCECTHKGIIGGLCVAHVTCSFHLLKCAFSVAFDCSYSLSLHYIMVLILFVNFLCCVET